MENIKKGYLLVEDFKAIVNSSPEWILNAPLDSEVFGMLVGTLIEVTYEDLGIQKLVTKVEEITEKNILEVGKVDNKLNIEIYKESPDAVIPTVAYNGTSACFDITAIESVNIPAGGSAMIENGLKIIVPHGWYMTLNTRSGHGIKKDLLCFRGIIDTGYAGPLGVKVFNLSGKDVVIEKGERYVQASFHKVHEVGFTEIDKERFEFIEAGSKRGSKGWGSTGK